MSQLASQPSAAPTQKLVAGTASGAAVVVILWVATYFGLDLSPEVAGAIVLLVSAAAAYFKRNKVVDLTPGKHEAA